MIRHGAAAVVVGVLLLTGCDSDRRAISRDDLPEVPSQPDHIVVVSDTGFDVSELDVETDDLIEFQVAEGEHRITATGPDLALLDTGTLLAGETTIVVLDRAATYELSLDGADASLIITSTGADDGG